MNNKKIFSPFFKINDKNELLYLGKQKICKLSNDEEINEYILKNEGVIYDEFLNHSVKNNALVLEPHSDDFALSVLGCTLNEYNTTVLNIFSKTNPEYFTWKDSISISDSEYEKIRLDESSFVVERLLGQQFISMREKSTRISSEDIDKIKNRIKNEIRLYLKHNLTDTIFVPMGIGNHPDHTVVFDSVLEIIDELKNYEIILYPEYPYARCKKSYNERLKYVSERLNITPRLKDISSKLDLIVDCISAFKSQFDDINRNQMLAIVREDCRALSTEYKTDDIVMVYFNIGGKKYEN